MRSLLSILGLVLITLSAAEVGYSVGVTTLPRFVEPAKFAITLEPELTFGSQAGLGVNGRYTQGVSDYVNLTGVLGTGVGPRQFRVGFGPTFDFFPDVDRQPGIGINVQAFYSRIDPGIVDGASDQYGRFEALATPYIHKAFHLKSGREIDPFFAVPFGVGAGGRPAQGLASAVIGILFKPVSRVRVSAEIGVPIVGMDAYFSTSIAYFHE